MSTENGERKRSITDKEKFTVFSWMENNKDWLNDTSESYASIAERASQETGIGVSVAVIRGGWDVLGLKEKRYARSVHVDPAEVASYSRIIRQTRDDCQMIAEAILELAENAGGLGQELTLALKVITARGVGKIPHTEESKLEQDCSLADG